MQLTTQYQTYNRGRQTSNCLQTMDVGDGQAFSFAGTLDHLSKIDIKNPKHIWISSNYPVDVYQTDSSGGISTVDGVLLFSCSFKDIASLTVKPSTGSLYKEDPTLEIQTIAESLIASKLP